MDLTAFADYGLLGVIVVLILTGQLVPRVYYNQLSNQNQELKKSLENSMELNRIQNDTIEKLNEKLNGR